MVANKPEDATPIAKPTTESTSSRSAATKAIRPRQSMQLRLLQPELMVTIEIKTASRSKAPRPAVYGKTVTTKGINPMAKTTVVTIASKTLMSAVISRVIMQFLIEHSIDQCTSQFEDMNAFSICSKLDALRIAKT